MLLIKGTKYPIEGSAANNRSTIGTGRDLTELSDMIGDRRIKPLGFTIV